MTKSNILLYDIEVLPNLGLFWGVWEQTIDTGFILKDKSIVTIAYKWAGKPNIHGISVLDFPELLEKDPYDDSGVLKEFIKVLNKADYIIGHNSDAFDNKFVQSRILINQLTPPKIPTEIDTLKLIKKHFNFNSNKLDYVSKLLGIGQKMKLGWDFWKRASEGDPAAIERMLEYNKHDVVLLEEVFNKILPYVDSKLNLNHFNKSKKHKCSSCGSDNVEKRGYLYNKITKSQRYQCRECGRWDKVTIKKV